MNTAIIYDNLPTAEREVAHMYAWGATKKDIANSRKKSIRTIENQIRSLFEKTETHKDSEFTAWYFCTRFGISVDLSPIAKGILTSFMLAITAFSIYSEHDMYRTFRNGKTKTEICKRAFKRQEIS